MTSPVSVPTSSGAGSNWVSPGPGCGTYLPPALKTGRLAVSIGSPAAPPSSLLFQLAGKGAVWGGEGVGDLWVWGTSLITPNRCTWGEKRNSSKTLLYSIQSISIEID